MKLVRRSIFTALTLALLTAVPAARADVTFNLNTVINGTSPVGASPWLTATFQDIVAGDVKLTLTNNLSSGQFITDVLFNSILDATSLTFTEFNAAAPPAVVSVTKSATQSLTGGSQIKGGGFNIDINYDNSPPGNRFGTSGGTVSIFEITGTGLTSANFLKLSLDNGSMFGGPYYMAADVLGIPAGTDGQTISGSIGTTAAIPEPETYAMMLAGLGMMGFVARRRKQPAA
jgi:hypothetical protein